MSRNLAITDGGAAFVNGFQKSFEDCEFTSNVAVLGDGGAIHLPDQSLSVENCSFRGNQAELGGGGALWLAGRARNPGEVSLTNCTLLDNTADYGGAVVVTNDQPTTMANLIFGRNRAYSHGGGLYNFGWATELANCTFVENAATFNGGGIDTLSDTTIINGIFWDNTDESGSGEAAQIHVGACCGKTTVDYTAVQGWSGAFGGVGNIGDDPLLVDPAGDDYHLSSGSPSIDTGQPDFIPPLAKTDLDGHYRIWNDRVDMGAYEFDSIPVIRGDMNCDHALNGADIDAFFLAVGDPVAYTAAHPICDVLFGDMNDDGDVNGADIDPFFACLGGNCP